MQVRMNSTFVQRGYNGLVDVITEQGLDDLIRAAFPAGSEVQADITLSLVRMRQLCEAWTTSYHSRCMTPLSDDGICPNFQKHWIEEAVEAEA